LLTFALITAGASLLAAVVALDRYRRLQARAERLAESYWELRYEIGQIRVRINRLEGEAGLSEGGSEAEVAAPRPASTTSFVPLSSLKK